MKLTAICYNLWMIKLNAKQLRDYTVSIKSLDYQKAVTFGYQKNDIYIILDNVLDTYNIGSVFRLADAVAAKRLILCGGSDTPPNHRIKKASINTTEVVEWEYQEQAAKAIQDLRAEVSHIQVIAIEQSEKSVPYDSFSYKLPVCLIVGNETTGVSKELLELCDGIVELPMFGVNISLNVMVSLGIVLYQVIEQTRVR